MAKYFAILFFFHIANVQAQIVDVYSRPVSHEPSHSFDVIHYKIQLEFDENPRSFQGQNKVTLTSLSNSLKQIQLHAESYDVHSVKIKDKSQIFSQLKGILSIDLLHPIDYQDTIELLISYGTKKFEVDPTQFGMSPNYPLGIGYFEKSDKHPALFNAYSFPTGARHWFPCYDHPNDRATHETIITTHGENKVLANGLLRSTEKHLDGMVTYHWSQDQPHPTYLYNFVVGPYKIIADSFGSTPVNYWVYPGDSIKGQRSFHRTSEVLAFFESYYGVKYPWDKFDQIIVPGIGGGAEATTATLIGASTLHDERAEQDFPSHWLVAHEAAHHWWGDFVSYADWTETWLSESFATFSEYLYSEFLYGKEAGSLNLHEKRNAYLNEANNKYQRPIVFNQWEFPNQNFDRHTYEKGALVLNMLRDYLGEEIFKKVLNHFLTKHAYQPVRSPDFLKSIWEVTGQNMDWFFDQWLFSPGHPVLDVSYTWENGQINLLINQVQDTSKMVPIFKFPVTIELQSENDSNTKVVWVNNQSNSFYFEFSERPNLVCIDPDNVILKEWTFAKTKEELMLEANYGGISNRLWAVQQLSLSATDNVVHSFLMDLGQNATFWAIRKEALLALTNNVADLVYLKDRAGDSNSKVRTTAIDLLGNLKNNELHEFLKSRFAEDNSYLVQAACIKALGKQKVLNDRVFFEGVLKMDSPRSILKRAAKSALAELD